MRPRSAGRASAAEISLGGRTSTYVLFVDGDTLVLAVERNGVRRPIFTFSPNDAGTEIIPQGPR